MWGRLRVFNPPRRRLEIGAQDTILPHSGWAPTGLLQRSFDMLAQFKR